MKTHKILLSLLGIITIGLVNFGNCFNSTSFIQLNKIHVDGTNYLDYVNGYNYSLGNYNNVGLYCAVLENFKFNGGFTGTSTTNIISIGLAVNTVLSTSLNNGFARYSLKSFNQDYWQGNDLVYCISNPYSFNSITGNFNGTNNSKILFSDYGLEFDMGVYYLNDNFSCSSCSQCETDLTTCQGMYSRLETDYDLLSGNYNTCVSDLNTCINNGGSSSSGDIQWSSLFINENQLLGNKNIFINIPLDYDYSYTNEGDDFELNVEGLNQDYDYLDGIVGVQNTTPTKENFNQIVSGLIPLFVPGLVVILFIYFVFRLLKKIF